MYIPLSTKIGMQLVVYGSINLENVVGSPNGDSPYHPTSAQELVESYSNFSEKRFTLLLVSDL